MIAIIATSVGVTVSKKVITKSDKHINSEDVQNEVNSNIRSLGVKVDTSLRPYSTSLNGEISGLQKYLDDATLLKTCKAYTKMLADEQGKNGIYALYNLN